MRKKNFLLMIMIAVIVLMSTLTGCSSNSDTTPSAVSLVLGNHRYFPIINLRAENIYQRIYNTAYSYGDCSIVVVDGEPYVAASYNITKPDVNIDNVKRRQIAKQNSDQIISDGNLAFAKTSEIDTLSAITKSSELLSSSLCTDKTMLIYDSGVSTTGLLNFSKENIIDADVSQIVNRLRELHALPSLSSVKVIWTGLGEVCGEQEKLSTSYKFKLMSLWEAIITASGGTVEFVVTALSSEDNYSELPDCSLVPVIADTLNVSTIAAPIKLGEDTVKFIGDRAEFIDSSKANAILKPIADVLKDRDAEVLLVGTTASVGSGESCEKLSLNRCYTVKDVLVGYGVKDCNIHCLGLGYTNNNLRVPDRSSSGELIESEASKNRAVFIIDYHSPLANELLKLS